MIGKFHHLFLFVLIFYSSTNIRAYTTQAYDDPDDLTFFPHIDSAMNGFTYPDGTGLMKLLPVYYPNNSLYIRLNGTLTNFTVPPPVFNATTYYTQRDYPLSDAKWKKKVCMEC